MREIKYTMPQDWDITIEKLEEDNRIVEHIEAQRQGSNSAEIDIYISDLVEDLTAEDQAFANYLEMVGVEDDEEEVPIFTTKFNNKTAYYFEAYTQEEEAIRVICQEAKAKTLIIISILAKDQEEINNIIQIVERTLRIKTS